MSDPGSVAFENGSAADSTQADDSKDRSDLAFTGHGPPTQNEATVNFCPSNGISSDEVTTVQEMSEEGAVMRVVRGSGQLNMEGNEFHVGNQVNVTHAHGELHQHVGTMVKKQIIQTNNFTCSDDIPGYDQIKDQSRMDMASGDNVFVETKGFHQALGLLKKHGVLVIQGPSGSGKSAIGYALLRHFDNLGYTPLILHRVQEWRSHIGGDRKQVVLLDGVFGEVCLDFESISKWSKTFNNMLEYAKSHKCLILLTVYAHITSEICASAHVGDFFQRVEILRLDLLPEFSKHEKREMARKYLTANAEAVTEQVMNEILTVKQCGPTFPWLLNEYFRFPAGSAQRSTILKAPERAHLPFLRKLLADKAHGHCFAAVLLLAMRTNSDFHCSLENLRQQLNEIGLPGIGAKAVQTAARHFTGNYIVKDRSCFTSRTTYNAAGLALGASEFLPNLLQVCDLEFLIQYVHTEDSHMEALKVDCKSSGYETFLERIYMEIVRGNIQEVCQIQSLQSKELLQNFKHFCENHKDFRKMLAAKDTKHKQTILYWSSFCPSTQLTDWVISEKSERLNQQNQQLTTELQQILFVYALSGKNTSCEIVKSVITAWKKNIRRPYLLDHLKLPLPSKKQRITEELQEVCHTMYTRTLPDTVCYLEDSSLVVPRELFSLRTFKNKISLNMPGKHWYLAFRLLADREADEKDAEGNTLLHLAADIGDIDDIKLAIKSGASLTAENTQSLTPPELARKRRNRAGDGNSWRTTVFKNICAQGDLPNLKILLCHDVDVHTKDTDGNTLLHICCQNGQTEAALLLLSLKANIEAVSTSGRTPLYCACEYGRKETAVMLLDNGAKTEASGNRNLNILFRQPVCYYRHAPLRAACENQHKEIVELLLQRGASVNERYEEKRTPLHIACAANSCDIVLVLVNHGADVHAVDDGGRTPLHVAIKNNFLDIVAFLMQQGACSNAEDETKMKATLFPACENGNKDIVLNLILRGDDINATDRHKRTPLHVACRNGHGSIAGLLIRYGAQVNAEDENMATPLDLACQNDFGTIVMLLIHHGAKVTTKDKTARTPLHLVSSMGHQELIALLIHRGAHINAEDDKGETPIYKACRKGHQDAVAVLLEENADVHVSSKAGKTPLHCACEAGETQVTEILVNGGADVNVSVKDETGQTPLHYACEAGHTRIAEILVNGGADVNARDNLEKTPVFYACQRGYIETAEHLIAAGADIHSAYRPGQPLPSDETVECSNCKDPCCPLETGYISDFTKTPLHAACEKHHLNVAELLLKHGADPNARDCRERTPLHYAYAVRNKDMESLLCQNGADEKAKDINGNLPKDLRSLEVSRTWKESIRGNWKGYLFLLVCLLGIVGFFTIIGVFA